MENLFCFPCGLLFQYRLQTAGLVRTLLEWRWDEQHHAIHTCNSSFDIYYLCFSFWNQEKLIRWIFFPFVLSSAIREQNDSVWSIYMSILIKIPIEFWMDLIHYYYSTFKRSLPIHTCPMNSVFLFNKKQKNIQYLLKVNVLEF